MYKNICEKEHFTGLSETWWVEHRKKLQTIPRVLGIPEVPPNPGMIILLGKTELPDLQTPALKGDRDRNV